MPSQDAREGPRAIPDPIHCDSTMVWMVRERGTETGGTVF